MKKVLSYYLEMFNTFKKDGKANFDNHEVYFGRYSDGKLLCESSQLMLPLTSKYKTVSVNYKMMNFIKKARHNDMIMEYDFLNYLPIAVNDMVSDGRMRLPRIRIVADGKSQMILAMKMKKIIIMNVWRSLHLLYQNMEYLRLFMLEVIRLCH